MYISTREINHFIRVEMTVVVYRFDRATLANFNIDKKYLVETHFNDL